MISIGYHPVFFILWRRFFVDHSTESAFKCTISTLVQDALQPSAISGLIIIDRPNGQNLPDPPRMHLARLTLLGASLQIITITSSSSPRTWIINSMDSTRTSHLNDVHIKEDTASCYFPRTLIWNGTMPISYTGWYPRLTNSPREHLHGTIILGSTIWSWNLVNNLYLLSHSWLPARTLFISCDECIAALKMEVNFINRLRQSAPTLFGFNI